jgi:hypothetical protein
VTTPSIETVKLVVTGSEDGAPARIQISFSPEWRNLLPAKVDASGSLTDRLVLTPAPDKNIVRGRSVVDRYLNGVCRVSLHPRFAGRPVKLGETFHVSSVVLNEDGTVEICPTGTVVQKSVSKHTDDPVARLRVALDDLNSTASSVQGVKLRVENNVVFASIEV